MKKQIHFLVAVSLASSVGFAQAQTASLTLSTGNPSLTQINTAPQGIRPYTPNTAEQQPGVSPQNANKSSNTAEGGNFLANNLPPVSGSLQSLCLPTTPGCENPVGQGAPSQGYALGEPPSLAPTLVAPTAPDVFEHVQTVHLAIPAQVTPITLKGDALFAFNSAVLRPAAQDEIQSMAKQLNGANVRAIVILAYSDSFGTHEANKTLTQARAKAVQTELIAQGIDPSRLYFQALPQQDYIVDPSSCKGSVEEQRACQSPNRRVTLRVLGRMTTPVLERLSSNVMALDHPEN